MDARGASPPSEATSSVAERCRRESHEALFRARSETVDGDGDDDSFVCDAVFRDAQLTCRIASATTRCRLSRAGASPRGDCAAMTDCERCVVAELGKGVAYVEDAEPTSSTWSGAAARALAGAFGRVSRASSSSSSSAMDDARDDNDDDRAGRIDRNMEWSVHLQEVASVRHECRHAELRWRNERTARALLGIHRAAEAAESESARRFERIAETTIEIAEAVAKTRAAAEALDAKLDVATIRIDDVNDALVAARVAHDAHDAVTRRGFDDVFNAVASARERVDEIADAIDAAAKTAATLSAHAANANESLNSVRDAVRWLVDSRVTVREQTRRFVSYAAVVAAVGTRESAVAAAATVAVVGFFAPFLETEFGVRIFPTDDVDPVRAKTTWTLFATLSAVAKLSAVVLAWRRRRVGRGDESAWRRRIESRLETVAADVAAMRKGRFDAGADAAGDATVGGVGIAVAAVKESVVDGARRRRSTRRRLVRA